MAAQWLTILADQHLLPARMFRQDLGLENHLDPLEMGRKALARPRSPRLARAPSLARLSPEGGDSSLDLLED
jgi:hypothetical protein